MLGDSLTQGYGLTEKNGLVPALQRWLSINNVEVLLINGGVSGNTTLGGAEQLDWLLSPDINGVVVALGGNDLLRGFDPEFTKNNLEKIFGFNSSVFSHFLQTATAGLCLSLALLLQTK